MPTHEPHHPEPGGHPGAHDDPRSARMGYEVSDANVSSVAIFMLSMAVACAVIFVFCFGMGEVINHAIAKRDGPLNKWNAVNGVQGTGANMASDATLVQEQLRRMTQAFPAPRVQTDDGDQDVVDLHAREDLLLDHYSWIDEGKGTVRIPISRAMEIIAKQGLPVVQQPPPSAPLMTGDRDEPQIPVPLTDGFARTGYEQDQLTAMQQERGGGQAELQPTGMKANVQ